MSTTNAINNESSSLTIDPGASGDSALQYSINGTPEFKIGVDDTDGDAFVISQGNALGTNNTFRISSAGQITTPLQPSFGVQINIAQQSDVTGDGTVYKVQWDTEDWDIGSNFASNQFVAPVSGIYHLTCQVAVNDVTSSSFDRCYVEIVTTANTFRSSVNNVGIARFANNARYNMDIIAYMAATNTAYVNVMVSGSTKTVDVNYNGGIGEYCQFFAGSLIS